MVFWRLLSALIVGVVAAAGEIWRLKQLPGAHWSPLAAAALCAAAGAALGNDQEAYLIVAQEIRESGGDSRTPVGSVFAAALLWTLACSLGTLWTGIPVVGT